MQEAMDLFGKAVMAYSKGDRSPFYFVDKNGVKDEHDLSKYFRGYDEFTPLEKRLVAEAKGRVLDVGCGTGTFLKYFSDDSLGIDISENMIKVAKKNGINNCKVANFFDIDIKDKFDSVVFAENNIGMAENIERTKTLLLKIKSLLSANGQILTNAPKVEGDYFEYEISPQWKNEQGEKFTWISFGFDFFQNFCAEVGLQAEIFDSDERYNLIKIRKI